MQPGDLPNPGIESVSLMSPALAGGFFFFLPLVPPGKHGPDCYIELCCPFFPLCFCTDLFSLTIKVSYFSDPEIGALHCRI